MSKTNKNTETASDSIYDLGYFNNNGLINSNKVKQHLWLLFSVLFITCILTQYYFTKIYDTTIPISNILMEFYRYNANIISTFIEYEVLEVEENYKQQLMVSIIIAMVTVLICFFVIYKKSKFQAILSSTGLSQYYLSKKQDKKVYLKFKKGKKNQYQQFVSQRENLAQLLNVENLNFKRWKTNGVVMQSTHKFPTVQDLSHLKVENFIKKDKFFLGIGLPNINEDIPKSELINGRYLPRYFNLDTIPHSFAILGSASGGKSNSLNQYLYSIFYNFERVHSLYFIDFKSIEVEPIKDLELKHKTKSIFCFDDNRTNLYRALKRLYFINKSRMRYLRAKKKKKFTSDFIVLIFDELAEILDHTCTNKEEKKMQEKIVFYLESLLRTSRSQNFKIFYAVQTYLSVGSKISSGMKNNTLVKISHQLGSKIQVSAIKEIEILNDHAIDPTAYDMGKNVVINEMDNTMQEVRSLYVPENFINDIQLNVKNNDALEQELKIYYKEVYDEWKKDLKDSKEEDDEIYPLSQIAKDLNFDVDTKDEKTPKEDNYVKKLNISKTIKENKTSKLKQKQLINAPNLTKDPNDDDFISSIK